MNARKSHPCPTLRPANGSPSSFSLPRSGTSAASSTTPSAGAVLHDAPARAGRSAIDADTMGRHRIGGRDNTCRHVIMSAMNTTPLPSPHLRPKLPTMKSVPPFVSCRGLPDGRRSRGSLAAVAGRVANGLRVSPAGSCSPARCLAPSCPPLRALAWGLFAALPFAPLAAQKSTVVSLL